MLNNVWFIACIWMGLALVASLISIRTGISVALVEILIGLAAGNLAVGFEGGTLQVGLATAQSTGGQLHHVLQSTEWTNFLALLGSGVLTFLAGAEIDPQSLKTNWRASLLIGVLSFAVPFGVVWFFAQYFFGWTLHEAQIAGIALSTTSVAVVYAVMIEGGFSDTAMGKMILAACFITDLGTVLALGTLFATYNLALLVFVIVTLIALWFMPKWTQFDHHPLWRDPRERTGSKIHFLRLVSPWWSGDRRQKRSRSARVFNRSGGCRGFPSRQNTRASHAQHRIRGLHALLFHQSRPVRLAARALDRPLTHWCFSDFENGDENRRRVSTRADALDE